MGVSLKTNKMIWGRAASRCSIPDCRRELVLYPQSTDDASLVGEVAHIVGEEESAPRGKSTLNRGERNKYDNLMLLCNVHHKQVDDQPNDFTVKNLKLIKSSHEEWVRSSLQFNARKQADDEKWAGYIDEWTQRACIDNWLDQTSPLLLPTPEVSLEFFERLSSLRGWLLSRVWPARYPDLTYALGTFGMIVDDFINVFQKHSDRGARSSDIFRTIAFYKLQRHEQREYERLVNQFFFHADLLHDLVFEMTRAANYVCDLVREFVDPSFRVEQGVILVQRGEQLKVYTIRLEYQPEERTNQPYPGLYKFMEIREFRDRHVGVGRSITEKS